MSLFTFVRQFVLRLQRRRTQTHGGAHSVTSTSESEPGVWNAGQALQDRTEFVESSTRTHARESTVRISGSSREEWIASDTTIDVEAVR